MPARTQPDTPFRFLDAARALGKPTPAPSAGSDGEAPAGPLSGWNTGEVPVMLRGGPGNPRRAEPCHLPRAARRTPAAGPSR